MAEAYALHEGAFGRAIVLELRANLVPHSHSDSQIAFWLGGAACEAHVGSHVVRYSDRLALGVNAYESHDLVLLDDSGPCVFLVFTISREWLDERRNSTGSPLLFRSPGLPLEQGLRRACSQVLHLIVSDDGARESIDTEVERLLVAAIEASAVPATAPQPVGSISSGSAIRAVALDRRLRAAISLMRERVADKLTIDQIGRRVGLSRAHLFALFRSQLNTTPQVFWSAVRVEEAMRRLVNEGEPLIDVALDLGFSAPGNFSRFFKDHTGASPSLFRRAARKPLLTPVTGISE